MYLVQSSKVLDWWIDKGTIGILHPWYGVYYVRYNVKWHADRSHKPVIWLKYKHFRSKKVHRNICGRASHRYIRTFEESSSKALLRKEFQNEDEVYVYISSLTLSTRWKANARVYCYSQEGDICFENIFYYNHGSKDSDRWERIYLCN